MGYIKLYPARKRGSVKHQSRLTAGRRTPINRKRASLMIKTGSRPKACLSGLIKRGALTIRKAPLFFAPPPAPASPFRHFVVSPPPCGGGQVLRYRCPRSLQAVDSKFLEEKGTVPLRHLPTPIQGVGGERSEPEGVSRQADTIHAALVIIMAST